MTTKKLTCSVCGETLDPILAAAGTHLLCVNDADLLATELFDIIADGILNQPRSLQRKIGPSELGTPCDRRLGYKLAGTPEVNERGVAWPAFVGTAIHSELAELMARASIAREARFLVEHRVTVGQVGGLDITGSLDLYDKQTGTVIDWKCTTGSQIRDKYRKDVGETYRRQAHLYGRGLVAQGYDVRAVMIVFFSRDKSFTDRHVWSEAYDEQVALDALARADSIATSLQALGPDFTIPALDMTDAHCRYCPWQRNNSTDLAVACPGAPEMSQRTKAPIALPVLI